MSTSTSDQQRDNTYIDVFWKGQALRLYATVRAKDCVEFVLWAVFMFPMAARIAVGVEDDESISVWFNRADLTRMWGTAQIRFGGYDMKNFKCTYKQHTRLVYSVRDRNEAAELSWKELGAPDAFCVDTEEFATLPVINLDPGDEDDTFEDKTVETILKDAGISW